MIQALLSMQPQWSLLPSSPPGTSFHLSRGPLSLASGPLHLLSKDSELASPYILLVRTNHCSSFSPLMAASFSKKLSLSLSWS